jgi:hypothetical protein
MSEKKQVTTTSTSTPSLFDKQNMWLMLLGVGVIAIGMLLMVGGRSKDPNTFNYDEGIQYFKDQRGSCINYNRFGY